MSEQRLLDQLAAHRQLGFAPRAEHEWLVKHGTIITYAAGDVVTGKGEQAQHLMIFFSGHVVIRMDRGAGSHKIFEWRAGDVGGVMPYSRGASPPNDAVAEEVTETLAVHKEHLAGLIRDCPRVTEKLVHITIDRAREFKSSDLRDEKLIALGKLAAGLAHELGNPASAALRSAKLLHNGLRNAETAARQLAEARLTDEQFASIEKARMLCTESKAPANLSSLARADREEAIADWLGDHKATQEFAVPLADTGVTIEALDELAHHVTGDALEASVRWLSACCLVRTLSSEIETAATRINNLVVAVKGFSYMDHAPTAEPVDIRQGVNDAFTMLASKLRAKSVNTVILVPDDLPKALAVGVELNQVWMNLIDNAIDAVATNGSVQVRASRELDRIVVRIIDDGPGIPGNIRDRILEPFFTTKGVGKGTGLGLDIVRRLLQRHNGELDIESEPGNTQFCVRLPVFVPARVRPADLAGVS